jgi:hypothetical protein
MARPRAASVALRAGHAAASPLEDDLLDVAEERVPLSGSERGEQGAEHHGS